MILRLAILPFEFPSEYLFQDHDFNNVDHGNAFPKLYTQQYNLVLLCNRYLLEQSLSVDNLFVFVLVFKYFKVPKEYQVCLIAFVQFTFKCTLYLFSLFLISETRTEYFLMVLLEQWCSGL